MNILKLVSVTHTFTDGNRAIEDINLYIKQGEFIVLAGRNGSGKTVLARHLNGLLSPSTGEIFYRDRPFCKRDLPLIRQKVGLVFQNPLYQFVGQTVREDISFGLENLRLPSSRIADRVEEALSTLGLKSYENQRPHLLSGGEQRKLAIAGILVMKPDIIILDEPFSGLDFPGTQRLLRQVVDLHSANHTIVVITHEIEKVLAHASRLIVMDRGKIVLNDMPGEIYGRVGRYGVRCRIGNKDEIREMTWMK